MQLAKKSESYRYHQSHLLPALGVAGSFKEESWSSGSNLKDPQCNHDAVLLLNHASLLRCFTSPKSCAESQMPI